MFSPRHSQNRFVSFAAAAVLLLQMALSAWATGAMAASPHLDAFGNPLCITSVDGPGFGLDGGLPGGGDHSKLPDCCTFGCSMVSAPLLARDTQGIVLSPPTAAIRIGRQSLEISLARHAGYVPGNPRAPPTAA